MRGAAALVLAAVLMSGTGCGTIRSFSTSEELWLYSGTRANLNVWSPRRGWTDCTGMSGLVALVDFPWSLALDTAISPVTLMLELFSGGAGETSAIPGEDPRRRR